MIRERGFTSGDRAAAAGLALAALVAAWFALIPARASAAVHRGDVALANGDGTTALAAYQAANRLLPGEGAYWEKTASLYATVKQPALALRTYLSGMRHDRYDVALLLNAAGLAQSQGDAGSAASAFRAALSLDPTGPATVEQAAAFAAAHGQAPAAAAALARAVLANPSDVDLLVALGAASRKAGDLDVARSAYRRALAIQPGFAAAAQGLRSVQ